MPSSSVDSLIGSLIVSFVALFGIFGNCLVVVAVKKKRSLRSTTNYLLVNLAISDIITLVFAHFGILQSFIKLKNGVFADILCKVFISFNVPCTAIFSSIFTVTVIAIERYHAVVRPMRSGIRLRRETIKYAVIVIWVLAMLLTLPLYVIIYYEEKMRICRYNITRIKSEEEVYRMFCMILIVLLPLITMTFCYFEIIRDLYFKNAVSPQNIATVEEVQNKRRMIKVALYVTLSFLVCYLPALIITFISASGYSDMKSNSRAMVLAWVLFFLEPVINPVIYAFQSTNFRGAFKEILRMKCCST